jgi:hypothetical protein
MQLNNGAVGMIMSGVGAVGYVAFVLLNIANSNALLQFVFILIFAVGLSCASGGYMGIKTAHKHSIGIAGAALGFLSFSIVFLSSLLVFFNAMGNASPYYSSTTAFWEAMYYTLVAGFVLFGVAQIVWGVTHIATRRFTGKPGLAVATGIMLIISGAITASYLLTTFGLILFFASAILAAIAFFTAKVPKSVPQPLPPPI